MLSQKAFFPTQKNAFTAQICIIGTDIESFERPIRKTI
jgi:hypothetical protein